MLDDLNLQDQPMKSMEFEQLLGVTTLIEVNIENPSPIRNKGCGLRKRLKGSNEVSKKKSSNRARSCKYCGGPRHDWRNCPVRKEDEKTNSAKMRPSKNKVVV